MNLPFLAIFLEIFRDDSAAFRCGQDLAPSLLFLRATIGLIEGRGKTRLGGVYRCH
jgi:hypothetical protein